MKGRHLVSDILAAILICQCVFGIENKKPGITERVIRKNRDKVFEVEIPDPISLRKMLACKEIGSSSLKPTLLAMMLIVPEM